MKYFESHGHYEDAMFSDDKFDVLDRLMEEDLSYLLNCCSDLSVIPAITEIIDRYPRAYASVGVHPHWTPETPDDYIEALRLAARHPKVVAIGEIGLDYFFPDPVDRQKRMFREQLELAKELDLPVIIHDRDAHEDTIEILEQYKLPGILHRYAGPVDILKRAFDFGMYVSFNCDLTYPQWNAAPIACLSETPWDRLLIETDCPYAPPSWIAEERCDSSMLGVVVKEIAKLRGVSEEYVAEVSAENAKKIYRIR